MCVCVCVYVCVCVWSQTLQCPMPPTQSSRTFPTNFFMPFPTDSFSGQGTVPPVPRGRVVRADGRAEPAASVVRDALELAAMVASSRHLTVLDLTACELDLQAPGLPGLRRSAFEVSFLAVVLVFSLLLYALRDSCSVVFFSFFSCDGGKVLYVRFQCRYVFLWRCMTCW